MKIKILILAFILFIIFYVVFKSRNVTQISSIDIKSFFFSYTSGTEFEASVVYELKCSDKCMALVKQYGIRLEDCKEIEVSKEIKEKLEEILIKYKVFKWNGFNKTNDNVLDGNSFSLNVIMNNDEAIQASGYMKWPDDYNEFKKEVDSLFSDLN